MNRGVRLLVFVLGGLGVGVVLVVASLGIPGFGGSSHPYRDHAVDASVAHVTANVVSSINFDQRGFDTLGEETILFGSVVGAVAFLRPARDEREIEAPHEGRALDSTRLLGYLLLPVTLLVGVDTIAHGQVTPGGGFQGGVVLATGMHLMYVAGSYRALERARPKGLYELTESIGVASFASFGVAGIIAAGSFLSNFLGYGHFGQLASAGTVPWLNIAVGMAVASSVILLLASFLEQAITIVSPRENEAAATTGDARGEHGGEP